MRCTLAAGIIACASTTASAQIFLATAGDQLYRTTPGGVVEQFALSDEIIGMHAHADGTVYAIAQIDITPTDRITRLYRLDDALGAAPSLTLIDDTLETFTSAVAMSGLGDDLYYISNGTTGNGRVFRYDLTNGNNPRVGTQTQQPAMGGFAINPDTGVAWFTDNSSAGGSNSLYSSNNYTPGEGIEIALSFEAGLSADSTSSGLHWFGGTLYAAIEDGTSGSYTVGSLDTGTGAYTTLNTLIPVSPGNITVGLAVLPTPGTLAIAPMLLLATRRRR